MPSKLYGISREELFSIFINIGVNRNLSHARKAALELYTNVPSAPTIKRWCREGNWMAKARKYDSEVLTVITADLTKKEAIRVTNNREALEDRGAQLLGKIDEMLNSPKYSKIKNYRDLEIAMNSAINSLKMAENLRGNIKDKEALEESATSDDRQKSIEEEFDRRTKALAKNVIVFKKTSAKE